MEIYGPNSKENQRLALGLQQSRHHHVQYLVNHAGRDAEKRCLKGGTPTKMAGVPGGV